MCAHFEENAPRGEFVMILGPAAEKEEVSLDTALAYARDLVREGQSTNQAAKDAAKKFKLAKRDIYNALLED